VRTEEGGSEDVAKLVRRWWASKALAAADRMRCAAGLAILHDRRAEDGSHDLEVLAGTSVEVKPDPHFPLDWSRVLEVSILGETGTVTYTRQDDGRYKGEYKGRGKSEAQDLGTWSACPVRAWYLRPPRRIKPSPYSTLLDAHTEVA
jgi:hypothetical protein